MAATPQLNTQEGAPLRRKANRIPQVNLQPFFEDHTASNGTTSSPAYSDYPGPADQSFTKFQPNTGLSIIGTIGAFAGVSGSYLQWGLRINSVDYDVGEFFFNVINQHMMIFGVRKIAVGLAPGTYTARVRWRSASSTLFSTDGNDIVRYQLQEVL